MALLDHGRGGAGFEAPLPLPHHAGLDVQLARDFRQRLVALQELLDDAPLELHGEDAAAVRFPWKLAHEAPQSCRSRIAPSVSSSIGEQISSGIRPSMDSMSAVTSMAARAARPPEQPRHDGGE